MEYQRTQNAAGAWFQWIDAPQYTVMDVFTGEMTNIEGKRLYGLRTALEHVKMMRGWENRLVIVKFDCIAGFKISERGPFTEANYPNLQGS